MSDWDLFTAAEAAEREARSAAAAPRAAPRGEGLNGALARKVADAWPDLGAALGDRQAEWAVSEVNAVARQVIEGVLPPLRVVGEITNFTRARSGHCYFSLRDEKAQLRCVMWRDEARRLPTSPAEGMEVRALGRLTLYEARGEFQFVVSVLEGRGDGLWKLAVDRLRAKLDAEGLTDAARKRRLPRYPGCVGVVTSAEGAALRDIVTVIRRRAPWTRIVLAACRVQGDGAAGEIAAAIRRIGRAGCADVLIVGRGGGSVEDLWAFNEESVARAIAASPVPVISAVGHETDVTIADLVADQRAPTPSAAAEAAVPDGVVVRRRIEDLRRCMAEATVARARVGGEALEVHRLAMQRASERLLRTRRDRLRGAAAHLNALSPLGVLARGYAVPFDARGHVLRGRDEFSAGDEFTLRVVDGRVPCRVEAAPISASEPEVVDAG